jgi:hypothetical protein
MITQLHRSTLQKVKFNTLFTRLFNTVLHGKLILRQLFTLKKTPMINGINF